MCNPIFILACFHVHTAGIDSIVQKGHLLHQCSLSASHIGYIHTRFLYVLKASVSHGIAFTESRISAQHKSPSYASGILVNAVQKLITHVLLHIPGLFQFRFMGRPCSFHFITLIEQSFRLLLCQVLGYLQFPVIRPYIIHFSFKSGIFFSLHTLAFFPLALPDLLKTVVAYKEHTYLGESFLAFLLYSFGLIKAPGKFQFLPRRFSFPFLDLIYLTHFDHFLAGVLSACAFFIFLSFWHSFPPLPVRKTIIVHIIPCITISLLK